MTLKSWYHAAMRAALLTVLLAVSARALQAQAQQTRPRTGGTLVIAGGSDLQMMNSLVNAEGITGEFINHLLFLPLVKLGPSLELQPALARTWTSVGDSIFTLRLRRDVRWHDGRPTTAHDVAFTFNRALDTLTAFPDAEAMASWIRAQVVDSFTVRLYGRPTRDPLLGLADLAIMPKHLLDSIPTERMRQASFNKNPVGNGPFRFVSQRANDRWVFEANTTFPRELGGRPYIDRLVWRVIPDNTAQITELKTGGVDIATAARAEQLRELDAAPELRSFMKPSRASSVIIFNTKRAPLDNPNVRRALTLALNREQLIKLLRSGYAQPASSVVPPTHWTHDPTLRPLPYDTAQARRLLAQAGFLDRNGDGILESADGKPFEFELKVAANNAFNRDLGEATRAELARIGVRVNVRPVDFASMLQQVTGPTKDFDAAYLRYAPDAQMNLYDTFHSKGVGGSLNTSSFSNPEADRLLDRIAAARTRAAAKPLWNQLQRVLRDQAPWAFMWYTPELYVINERVRGLTMDIRGAWVNLPRVWLADAR